MKKSIAFLLVFSLIVCISPVVLTSNALDTYFKAQLSGNEYGVVGDKYVVNLEIGNFTKEEFLGATAYINYDTSVFEVSSSYLEIINGTTQGEGINAETYPLIDAEEGWVFWGKNIIEDSSGIFMVNILNDGNEFTSLKGKSVNCFIEFSIKSDAPECTSVFEIYSDEFLVGVFSEELVESAYGEGSSLSVDIYAEEPVLTLNPESEYIIIQDNHIGANTLKGFETKTTVSDLLANFSNDSKYLRVVSKNILLNDDDFVTTGVEIQFHVGNKVFDRITAVCLGDVDFTNSINITDYALVKAQLIEEIILDEYQLSASDIDMNQVINATDYMELKELLLGSIDK